jgi:hypothetical protein
MNYQYTSQELNAFSVSDLVSLNVINPICARDYADSKATMRPYQFFCERGMIQTTPINYSKLIPDAKATGGELKDMIKFCMVNSGGKVCPGRVKDMLNGSLCYKCFIRQTPASVCSKCGAILLG